MRVTMLVPTVKKIVSCNLRRRMIACVTHKNIARAKFIHNYDESNFLPTAASYNVAVRRIYCTESNSQSQFSLPMLVEVDRSSKIAPTFFAPFKLFYLTVFKIVPNIDKDFDVPQFITGATQASSLISKALMNKDYESLSGLVTESMIETLRTKIETLTPNQRQLIAVNKDDMIFYTISDINVTTNTTGDEHSIEMSTVCHYTPDLPDWKRNKTSSISDLRRDMVYLICHYTFVRKYVNNVGGPWIVTFVNHYSLP